MTDAAAAPAPPQHWSGWAGRWVLPGAGWPCWHLRWCSIFVCSSTFFLLTLIPTRCTNNCFLNNLLAILETLNDHLTFCSVELARTFGHLRLVRQRPDLPSLPTCSSSAHPRLRSLRLERTAQPAISPTQPQVTRQHPCRSGPQHHHPTACGTSGASAMSSRQKRCRVHCRTARITLGKRCCMHVTAELSHSTAPPCMQGA